MAWLQHMNSIFMNAIRKKLNLKIEEDYIKTVRGVGYIAND